MSALGFCQRTEDDFPVSHEDELDLKAQGEQASHGKQLIYNHSVAPIPSRWRYFFIVTQETLGGQGEDLLQV